MSKRISYDFLTVEQHILLDINLSLSKGPSELRLGVLKCSIVRFRFYQRNLPTALRTSLPIEPRHRLRIQLCI